MKGLARYAWLALPALLLGAGLGVQGAEAQSAGWLADRKRAEGPGFRVGNLELHPGAGLEGGYDTNVFLHDANPVGSPLLRLTVHLLASTLGPQRMQDEADGPEGKARRSIAFRGGVSASLYHYFSTNVRTNVEGDASLDLTINPDGVFQLKLHENFGRTVRPFTDSGASSYGRNRNVAGLDLGLQSRGGVFRGALGYRFDYEFFDADSFRGFDSATHRGVARTSWRFLPFTAFVHETDVKIRSYNGSRGSALLPDGIVLTSRLGINGALSRTFSFGALVGYSAGFFEQADEYETLVGRLEARLQPNDRLRWSVGYDRSADYSYLGNFRLLDKGYTNLSLLFGGAMLLGLEGSVGYERTGTALATDGSPLGSAPQRTGLRASASLFGEYRVKDWLAFNLSAGWQGFFTDYVYRSLGMRPLPDPSGAFQRFDVWGGVRVFY